MNSAEPTLTFARLIALHDDVAQPEYTLAMRVHQIGRLPELCEIVIHRKTVSRLHAEIEGRGSHFVLRNLSRNLTFVDGQPLEGEHILTHGEQIGLASPEALLAFVDADPTVVQEAVLRYDAQALRFVLRRQPLDLTPSQFRLLQHLYQHQGRVCTRESCARAIWQEEYLPEFETDNLDKVLYSLRDRLRKVDPNSNLIQIRRGIGYVLEI